MQLLESILGKKNNIKIIRNLIMHKEWQYNITELSRDININKGVLSRLIEELETENIIEVSRKGKIKLFSINKGNPFIKDIIIPLFEKENNFYQYILKDFINKLKDKTESIILYGSFARGTAKLSSDVDVLVIVNKKNDELKKEIEIFKENFLKNNMLLRVDTISILELKNLYKKQEPFIRSVVKNHKVLSGKPLMEVLNEKRK